MDVEIQEVQSTVRAFDGDAAISPRVFRQIVDAVMRAIQQAGDHDKKAGSERAVTGGVSAEQDKES